MEGLNVDNLISRLMAVGVSKGRLSSVVPETELIIINETVACIFAAQNSIMEIMPPVVVCGDIHGQYSDLLRIFDKNGFPPENNYLFMGDYVDRGRQNLETICLMFCLKIKFPENFFLLRGNHECAMVNRVYGFFEECNRRYKSTRLWQSYQDTFNWMPLTGLVGGRVLCMHGGLSPFLGSLNDLRTIPRPLEVVPNTLANDLLWSDPDPWVQGWQPSCRGVSYVFGEDVVNEMCQRLEIDLVCRAHQVVQDGYEFFGNQKLVTVFSAPNYCGQFDNFAATLQINADLVCNFMIYKPILPLRKSVMEPVREGSKESNQSPAKQPG